jgi:hypothetical protein
VDWENFPTEIYSLYDLWLAYLASRAGLGAHYEAGRLASYRAHPESDTALHRLDISRARIFIWSELMNDPRLAHLRPQLRRGLGDAYLSFGGAALDADDRRAGQQALRKSVAVRPGPRSVAAFAGSLVAPKLSRRAASLVRSHASTE